MAANNYFYGSDDQENYGYDNVSEYLPGSVFTHPQIKKPKEDLSDDEIKERIDALRYYMIAVANRVELESNEEVKERMIFSTKNIENRAYAGSFIDNIESYETKTLFGAYVMFLEGHEIEGWIEYRDIYDDYQFGSYYDLVVNRIFGFPTKETVFDLLNFVVDEEFRGRDHIFVTEINRLPYNLNTAVKSSLRR